VAADQIQQLFAKPVAPYLAPPIFSILYASVVWKMVPHWRLWVWMSAIFTVMVLRVIVRRLYRRARPTEAEPWGRISTFLSGLNGLLWGLAVFWVYLPDSLGTHMLYAFMCAGFVGGATGVSANHLPSYFAYVNGMLVPLTTRFLMHSDWLHHVMAICVLIYLVSIGAVAVTTNRTTREASRLRFRLAAANDTLARRGEERERLLNELSEANLLRERLLGVVGHDLKTPLAAVTMAAELLRRDVADEGVTKRVDRILRCVGRMKRLIGQLLDFGRIRAMGGMPVEITPVDLHALCRHVIDELTGAPPRYAISLETSGDGWGVWDGDRLAQVLSNLVGNAIQHGGGGAVSLRVSDEGGNVAMAHGGQINVESADGEGTTFAIRLPRRAGAREVETREDTRTGFPVTNPLAPTHSSG
jgi:signal transduction histidine kinase